MTDPPTPATPAQGEIWWLAVPRVAAMRIPVLIIGPIEDESFREPAFDVAPLWTAEDLATPGDLILDGYGISVRRLHVIFRRQRIVAHQWLEEPFASLTSRERRLLGDALRGRIPPERTGPELESAFDPRLSAHDWMEPVLCAAAPRERR